MVKNKNMRILVTNDDGIDAPGIKVLEKIARGLSDDVWVVAPEVQQSGASHSVSLHRPVRFKKLGEKRYSVLGTPTDCVIAALRVIIEAPVDLILSGVNRGPNIADDVTHSGTVAAAMEGALCDIRSIAFSQALDFEVESPLIQWATAEKYAPAIIENLLALPWEKDAFFNVNFPDLPPNKVKGVKCVAQGKHRFFKQLLKGEADTDGQTYWVHWADAGADPRRPDVDIHWLPQGYVTVTPICLDLTHHAMLSRHKKRIES